MKDDGHVLVVGAAGIDVKGMATEPLIPQSSTPGQARRSFGGVGRNIAENLARLEIEVVMLSAVGTDFHGESILAHGKESGIDTQYIRRCPEGRTGSYISILDSQGDLALAVSDYEIMEFVDDGYLQSHQALFESARMIVIDLNMTQDALKLVFELASAHKVPVIADTTSPARTAKLLPYLNQLYMICPNAAETAVLCGLDVHAHDYQQAMQAAHHLVMLGTNIAIVTLGDHGLAYADRGGSGHIPAVKTRILDATGAGDALTAGVIFGLLNDIPLDDAMRLGVTAASVTLQSHESVAPDLTPDRLYDSLVV